MVVKGHGIWLLVIPIRSKPVGQMYSYHACISSHLIWFYLCMHDLAVPAAGYIKSQQYIPLSLSRGSHFLDASRNAVLLSALTPDDNDLFMSNVVNTPILAIHG